MGLLQSSVVLSFHPPYTLTKAINKAFIFTLVLFTWRLKVLFLYLFWSYFPQINPRREQVLTIFTVSCVNNWDGFYVNKKFVPKTFSEFFSSIFMEMMPSQYLVKFYETICWWSTLGRDIVNACETYEKSDTLAKGDNCQQWPRLDAFFSCFKRVVHEQLSQ